MTNAIQEIITQIDEILLNKEGVSIDILGSYIVGATIVRDDYEQYQDNYPLLDEVAELGAELETLKGSEHAEIVLNEIKNKFNLLKDQVTTT